MIHIDYGILNVSPIRNNINDYLMKEKNCCDCASMFLLYDGHLGDTIISGNTDLSRNDILKSRDLVLSYLHIGIQNGDTKYMI